MLSSEFLGSNPGQVSAIPIQFYCCFLLTLQAKVGIVLNCHSSPTLIQHLIERHKITSYQDSAREERCTFLRSAFVAISQISLASISFLADIGPDLMGNVPLLV